MSVAFVVMLSFDLFLRFFCDEKSEHGFHKKGLLYSHFLL